MALNPMGKVPALRHGDTIVTEAAAICAYLADVFPRAELAPPPGSRERGPYYRWLFFAAGPVEAANTNKALGVAVPPERSAMVGYGTQERTLATLEDQLQRSEYIAGDRFTAADVYVGSHIGLGMTFGAIDKRPAFERYWALVGKRPAALRAREIDDIACSGAERPADGGSTRAGKRSIMRLKGKAALVTGAGQGFGFGIAEAFVREGARVACLDLKGDVAEAAAKRFGPSAMALQARRFKPQRCRARGERSDRRSRARRHRCQQRRHDAQKQAADGRRRRRSSTVFSPSTSNRSCSPPRPSFRICGLMAAASLSTSAQPRLCAPSGLDRLQRLERRRACDDEIDGGRASARQDPRLRASAGRRRDAAARDVPGRGHAGEARRLPRDSAARPLFDAAGHRRGGAVPGE